MVAITVKKRNAEDEALKAAFIAKNGVKKIEAADIVAANVEREAQNRNWRGGNPGKGAFRPKGSAKPLELTKPEDMGLKPVLMWVPVDQIHVNETYQRPISTGAGQRVIKHIAQNFRWSFFTPLSITQREDGGYWVIDGQHRTEAAKLLGIREIPAILVENLSLVDQAKAFSGINGKRVNVNQQALHHAMLAAGDELSLVIQRCCEEAGVVIPRYPKAVSSGLLPNETMCISTLKSIQKKHGDQVLIDALKSIRHSYPSTPGMLNKDQINSRVERALSRQLRTGADF